MGGARLVLSGRGRAALLGALGLFAIAFFTVNILVYLAGVFFLGLVVVSIVTFARASAGFGVDTLRAERVECSSFVRAGEPALVTARVRSTLPGSFYTELFDAHPDALALLEGNPRLLTWWSAGETLTLGYVVAPRRRGRFALGPIRVVAHDSLGLAFRATDLPSPWQIEAIPEALSVPAAHPRRLPSMVVGQTWLSTRGAGSDFRDLRPYQPTDELRSIAWTRSGQGTLYVREHERESLQDVVVLLDTGRTMALGPVPGEALERAIETAAVALRIAFDEGSRAGILVYAGAPIAYVPPGRGATHEFRVLRALSSARVEPTRSSLAEALRFLAPRLRRAASLLAFGSLDGEPDAMGEACGLVRRAGHRLYALVPDAEVLYPPLEDAAREGAMQILLDPEIVRARSATEALRTAGASVARLERGGAVATLNTLYGRGGVRTGAA
jgi:uncharacterized protein (DUF58 family)